MLITKAIDAVLPPLTLVKLKASIEAKTHPGAILGSYRQQWFSNHTEENKLKQHTPKLEFLLCFTGGLFGGSSVETCLGEIHGLGPASKRTTFSVLTPVGLPLSRKAKSTSWLVTRGA